MKNRVLFAAAASLLTFAGCSKAIFPNGNIVTETRALSGFDAVYVSDGLWVTINSASSTESVTVEAADNVIGYVETYLSGRALIVKIRDGVIIRRSSSIRVTVHAASIGALSASGGAVIECPDLTSDNLVAELSGGSRLRGRLMADNVTMSLSGGSHVEGSLYALSGTLSLSGGSVISVDGSTDMLTLSCSGGSVAGGFGFRATDTAVGLSGGSVVKLTVDRDIIVDASGGSKLIYRGSGTVVRHSLTGGSTVLKE